MRVIPKTDDGKEVQNTSSEDGQLKNLKYFTMRILETSGLLQFGDEGVRIIKHGAFFFPASAIELVVLLMSQEDEKKKMYSRYFLETNGSIKYDE